MPKIISIANQKGGVGKTTTAFNIGAGLINKGYKVLLIDLDPQANLSDYLSYQGDSITISDLLSQAIQNKNIDIESAIQTCEQENIDFIPSNIILSSADIFLLNTMCREKVLNKIVKHQSLQKYDYIIIDCLPSLGILLVNALACSDMLIIPVQAQKFALDGVDILINTVFEPVKTNLNPNLKLGGIILTMRTKTNMADAVEQSLRSQYGEFVLKNVVRNSVEATNSTYDKKSLINTKNSKLGLDYKQIVSELNRRW